MPIDPGPASPRNPITPNLGLKPACPRRMVKVTVFKQFVLRYSVLGCEGSRMHKSTVALIVIVATMLVSGCAPYYVGPPGPRYYWGPHCHCGWRGYHCWCR